MGLLGGLSGLVPFIAENMLALVAATFLYLPAWVMTKRGLVFEEYGLTARPLGRGLAYALLAICVSFPPFIVGWHLYQTSIQSRVVVVDPAHLVRFDRTAEGRPELPLIPDALSVWVERDQLYLAWPESSPVDVEIRLTSGTKTITPARVYGLSIAQDGLRIGSRGYFQIDDDAVIHWRRPNAGGLRLPLSEAQAVTIRTDSALRLGRFGVAAESPWETSRSPWWWMWMLFNQVVLIALPEEWFFRGYLQTRLDTVWRPRWRLLGTTLGPGWLVSSVLFALGHLIHSPSPHRLAVFFPSLLFGWLRARTGSVLASTLYHAACNVLAQALVYLLV